jgi:hypothetical protein
MPARERRSSRNWKTGSLRRYVVRHLFTQLENGVCCSRCLRVRPADVFSLDIETGKIVWEIPQAGPADGKRDAEVLGTAAGIPFDGDASGCNELAKHYGVPAPVPPPFSHWAICSSLLP